MKELVEEIAEKTAEEAGEEKDAEQTETIPATPKIKAIHWVGGAEEGNTIVEYVKANGEVKTMTHSSTYSLHQAFEKTFDGYSEGSFDEAEKFYKKNFPKSSLANQ